MLNKSVRAYYIARRADTSNSKMKRVAPQLCTIFEDAPYVSATKQANHLPETLRNRTYWGLLADPDVRKERKSADEVS